MDTRNQQLTGHSSQQRVPAIGAGDQTKESKSELELILDGAKFVEQPPHDTSLSEGSSAPLAREAAPGGEISQEMIDVVQELLVNNPELVSGKLLHSLGDYLLLTMANEAAIGGRIELDEMVKKGPERFLFLDTYIDVIGQKFGKRWVPDKGINQAILEYKLQQEEQRVRPLYQRVVDAIRNTGPAMGTSITQMMETVLAQKVAVQDEVMRLQAQSEALKRKMQEDESQQAVRLAEANAKFVTDQSLLRLQMDADIQQQREGLGVARQQHEQQLSQILSKIAEAQARLDELTGLEGQLKAQYEIKNAQLEAQYEQRRLELEREYQRQKAALETEILSLTTERDRARVEMGLPVNPHEDLQRETDAVFRCIKIATHHKDDHNSKLRCFADLVVKLGDIETRYGRPARIEVGEEAKILFYDLVNIQHSPVEESVYSVMTEQNLLDLAGKLTTFREQGVSSELEKVKSWKLARLLANGRPVVFGNKRVNKDAHQQLLNLARILNTDVDLLCFEHIEREVYLDGKCKEYYLDLKVRKRDAFTPEIQERIAKDFSHIRLPAKNIPLDN